MSGSQGKRAARMRAYWEQRAQRNAAWYVDTSLSYDAPQMDRFYATGATVVAQALDDAPVTPAGRSLAVEIGSGLGRIALALADRFDAVVGVDISPGMVERARAAVSDPRVRFEVGDGASLVPVADASADLVLSFTVFQHIPDVEVIEGYLREAGRVLRPGGVCVFQWNNTPGALRWAVRRTLLSALQRSGLRRERHGRNDAAFLGSRVGLDRVQRALRTGGLELVDVRGAGTLWAWAWAVRR